MKSWQLNVWMLKFCIHLKILGNWSLLVTFVCSEISLSRVPKFVHCVKQVFIKIACFNVWLLMQLLPVISELPKHTNNSNVLTSPLFYWTILLLTMLSLGFWWPQWGLRGFLDMWQDGKGWGIPGLYSMLSLVQYFSVSMTVTRHCGFTCVCFPISSTVWAMRTWQRTTQLWLACTIGEFNQLNPTQLTVSEGILVHPQCKTTAMTLWFCGAKNMKKEMKDAL